MRVIDAFVDALPLLEMGFKGVAPKATGRPSFDPAHLLKLYLYGYYNRIRSSRKLEKECRRNLEVQWLLGGLTPAYYTIADFRKQHPHQLKKVFSAFVAFLKEVHLLKGKYVAIDGTKLRAQNSRKNNFNQRRSTVSWATSWKRQTNTWSCWKRKTYREKKERMKPKQLEDKLTAKLKGLLK